jgi:hypothetical protein
MAVSKNTLTTDIWDTIYTYIQTTNPITTNNIYSAWNSTLAKSKGYPLVIMLPPTASVEKLNVTGSTVMSDIMIAFDIYHNSAQNLKVVIDEVRAKLLAGRSTFAGVGLKNMQIEGGDFDSWEEGKKKIHRGNFEVKFRYVEI